MKEIEDNIPPAVRPPLWMDLLTILGVFVAANIAGGLLGGLFVTTAGADKAFGTFAGYTFAMGATIAFALWLRARRGTGGPAMSWSLGRTNPPLVLWGLVLVVATSVVIEPLLEFFPDVHLGILKDAVGQGGWAILTTVVAAPLLEETLFRGVIQGAIAKEHGAARGVLLGAAIFGAVHILPVQVVNAFFIGLILGYIYMRTRSLVPVVLIHATNNALAYITMTMAGDDAALTVREMIPGDTLYWVVYGLCAVIFAVACVNVWAQLDKADRKGMA